MQKNVMIGLLLLIGGNFFSAWYDVSVKWLPDDANAASYLMLRQVTSVLMLLPFWLCAGRPRPVTFKVHAARANIGVVGALSLVMGLMVMPLATVSSLFYSAPLMIMLLGFFLLKEKVTKVQWICALLGFLGIMIILRPGELNIAGIIVLFSAFTFAINQMALKKLPDTEHPIMPLIMYNLLGIPLAVLIAAYQGFAGFSWQVLVVAIASNAFLLAYHWLCVLAYRQAQASDIAIAEYTGLLFIVFFGWLLFDEWLDSLTWLGAALVVLPSLILPALIKLLRSAVPAVPSH
ncbi:membrane protein [Shewanella sp. NFH-SH190041]|uniref:DMT family transporter n=1 Tax=Shewanella sp. NFH-SH190041 TaxID=2950245 RepID=UPI0021C39E22|nr:DMT family transporter [Shewanella sp. NFH-SH190041]BDM66031.1 membrane protein [Shewanella sp. NFH-SH190041]